MIVADKDISLQVSGNGDVLEPHDGILGRLAGGLVQSSAHTP
jgi:ATP-dependent protease HslVU (ClpYQ) peptidase subunit